MTLLVDDQLLSVVLRGEELPESLRAEEFVFTTGHWYVRLCQAASGVSGRSGVLSGPFAALPPGRRDEALSALLQLPEEIGLVSLRDLGPIIAPLRSRHRLNILAIEALAAAVHLGAFVALSARSPGLERALDAEGRHFEVID